MSRNLPSILDQMPDIAYLEQLIASLHDAHGIRAFLLDQDNHLILFDNVSQDEFSCKKIYPLDSIAGISGLLCTAEREEVFVPAEKSIGMCCAGISALLQKETEVQQMSEEILELSEQINFLFNLSKSMIGIKRLQTFCEMSLKEISKKIGADYGFISIKDTHNKSITAAYHLSREESFKIQEEKIFEIARERSDTVLSTIEDHISAIVSPITTKDSIIGFIAFFRNNNKRFFTSYEKKFVSIVNNSISYIIETLRLYDNLKQLYLNTVKALAAAIDAKDPYTHGHSFRVAKYSMAIARKLQLSDDDISELEIAGYMHDLGKIGVPEEVLRKPGKLTEEEFEAIKKHPEYTGKILEPINLPEFIVNTALHHHERLDGSGYPFGLSGDEISFTARIVAVADVFDALTSDRPYRPAMPVEKALSIICNGIDVEFDRNVAKALIDLIKEGMMMKEIGNVYRNLKFEDIQNLNSFLLKLTDQLIK